MVKIVSELFHPLLQSAKQAPAAPPSTVLDGFKPVIMEYKMLLCLKGVSFLTILDLLLRAARFTWLAVAGKSGQWALSQQAYTEMLGRKPPIRRDVYTYSALIKACQVCGNRWKLALDYLDQAKKAGKHPLPPTLKHPPHPSITCSG